MSEYIRSNEKLLNDLMAEYWSLRQDLGGRHRLFNKT